MIKQTIKQIFSLLGAHLIINLVFFFFLIAILGFANGVQWLKTVISVFAVIIYIYTIFECAYSHGIYDNKKHTPCTPYPLKGIVLSTGIVLFTLGAFLFYTLSWYNSPSVQDASYIKIIANLLYSFMTAFMWDFMDMKGPDANLFAEILSLIIPMLASMCGYYVAYKKIDYRAKFNKKFVYEDKNKKDV